MKLQLITSLFCSVVELKTEALVPATFPFTFHWYTGLDPPFCPTAVKLIALPAQKVVGPLALMLTDGVIIGFTVMVSTFERTVAIDGHGALELS